MDIKKAFDFVPSDRHAKEFFLELRSQNKQFKQFANLQGFTEFMYGSAGKNFALKDACILEIISGIQDADNKAAGLNLITYLLAPGLQNILMRSVFGGGDLEEIWSVLSWEFFQSILHYPTINRPYKIAANLLFDTHHRIRDFIGAQQDWNNGLEPIERYELKIDEEETTLDSRLASALLEGRDHAGLGILDIKLIISSRVYGESMKSLADRLGLSYQNALKRRNRAEKHLRDYWQKIINEDN